MDRTDEQVRQAARDGAALLDVERPGWADRIVVDELDLTQCHACVLGQTYAGVAEADESSGYEFGVRVLSGFTDLPWADHHYHSDSAKFATEYGFLGLSDREYAVLNEEWRRLIEERVS